MTDPVYQIKVTLLGSVPPIWRRILVPARFSLAWFHIVLQAVMGWENYHLHVFKINGLEYGDPHDDDFFPTVIMDEHDYSLAQTGLKPGSEFQYIYDFGDGWVHKLEVEATQTEGIEEPLPRCLDGKQSGPPEDVGGIAGFYDYLHALKDRSHPRHKEMLAWRGSYDPDKFDPNAINARLFWMSNTKKANRAGLNAIDELDLVLDYYPSLTHWAGGIDSKVFSRYEELPLRRDMVVLVSYLRDHKISGTQSAGNLPLKPAKVISAQFVDPPAWEYKVGDMVDQVRSSADIWQIYFLMALAEVGKLVQGGPARRFHFTRAGSEFLAAPAPLQAWYLLAVWWTKVNWLIAYPYEGAGEQMPFGFNQIVGEHLMNLPVNKNIPVAPFAKYLVTEGRLTWDSENQDMAQENLIGLVERAIIVPLVNFEILVPHFKIERGVWGEVKKLASFQITQFGKQYLEPLVYPGRWL
jgi:hypothetical protein